MTRLEDELRATFAGRVAEVPGARDRAGSAIARGRAARRRHRVIAGAAAFLVVALVASGTWWIHGDRSNRGMVAGPGPGPSATRPISEPPQPDFVVGGELRPADGRPIRLPGSGDVYDAVKVPEGWVVVRGDKATHRLWLVRPDGSSALLLDELPSTFAFSRRPDVLAYQQGDTVTVMAFSYATVEGSVKAVMHVTSHEGPQGRTGAELVGWAGGEYLVVGDREGLDYKGFALMPVDDNQSLAPRYNRAVTGVYGVTPGGRSVVGEVRNPSTGQFCAATLDLSAAFTVVKHGECGQPHLSLGRHALSPDGRRVLGRIDGGIAIADATNGKVIATVPAPLGEGSTEAVWVDAGSFVIPQNTRLLYIRVHDPTQAGQISLPSTSERWMVVAPAGA